MSVKSICSGRGIGLSVRVNCVAINLEQSLCGKSQILDLFSVHPFQDPANTESALGNGLMRGVGPKVGRLQGLSSLLQGKSPPKILINQLGCGSL